ncbi:MAG: response regulator [Syntrophobacteraceae bacterium]
MLDKSRKVSIVMVDDDEDDCLIIKSALQESELNHTLLIINSGLELMDYLRGSGKYEHSQPPCPDLILLDLYMPGISGREVLREIRKDLRLKQIDVVVLTDSTEWSELSECYDLGATAVFTKGTWLETFAEVIRISGPYWFKFITVQLLDASTQNRVSQEISPGAH